MPNVRVSLAWSFASQYITTGVGFFSVLILARLLTPVEIGIYSIAAAVFSIGQWFRGFGIAEYIVQEQNLTIEKLSSAFTLSALICWFTAALFFSTKSLVSEFYNQPEIVEIFDWLVINFILAPFGTATMAMLKREMCFDKIFVVNVIGGLTHTAVGLTAAYLGYSYMSLAWASVSSTVVTVISLMLFRPKGLNWTPGIRHIGEIARFGWRVSVSNLAGHLSKIAPEMIVGKVLGAYSVAILGKASSTTNMFQEVVFRTIAGVAKPTFARMNRENTEIKSSYLLATASIVAIAWPFFFFFFVHSEKIVLLLFGDQWAESSLLLQIMCIAAIIKSPVSFAPAYLISIGQVNRLAQAQVFFLFVGTILLVSTVQFGLQYVCVAIVFEMLVRVCFFGFDLKHRLRINLSDYLPIFSKGILITLFSMIGPLYIEYWSPLTDMNLFVAIMLSGVMALSGWLVALYLTGHVIGKEVRRFLVTISNRR